MQIYIFFFIYRIDAIRSEIIIFEDRPQHIIQKKKI